jgi:hypothetical protein
MRARFCIHPDPEGSDGHCWKVASGDLNYCKDHAIEIMLGALEAIADKNTLGNGDKYNNLQEAFDGVAIFAKITVSNIVFRG